MAPLILDNTFDESFVKNLEQGFFSNNFPWFYVPNIGYDDVKTDKLSIGFSHSIFGRGNYNIDLVNDVSKIVSTHLSGTITLARAFLHIPVPEYQRPVHDSIHTDKDTPHTVCLYYVNDSEGDTLLFDKTYETGGPDQEMNITHKVTPKRGRVLIFDGRYYHCSTPPNKTPRCIINFNII